MAGDVTLFRERERVLQSIQGIVSSTKNENTIGEGLAQMLYNILDYKRVDRQTEQRIFRTDLINHYDSQPEGWKKDIWCPVTKDWQFHKKVTAAHIVPCKIGTDTMGILFGAAEKGYDLMFSVGNGLMMHSDFEKEFDKFSFCLVPVEKESGPDGWQIILINEELRHRKIYGSLTWDHYDGTELQFRNESRPQHRFLYFHYFICVYKSLLERTQGWRNARDRSASRKIWATPGPYLRSSMLGLLAKVIGDEVELPDMLINDGADPNVMPVDAQKEEKSALDIGSMLLQGTDSEDEETDDEDDLYE